MDQESKLVKASLTLEDVREFKHFAAPQRDYAERLSLGLTFRLLTKAQSDAPHVLDAIDRLEGNRPGVAMRKATQYRRAPLHPLWHQHYVAPRHTRQNIGIRWGLDSGGNRDLDDMIATVANHGDDVDRWPKVLTHRFVIGGFEERARAGRLTGDWIIFAVHQGMRYYLDLATHEEGLPSNAPALLLKLRASAASEFPFAFATYSAALAHILAGHD